MPYRFVKPGSNVPETNPYTVTGNPFPQSGPPPLPPQMQHEPEYPNYIKKKMATAAQYGVQFIPTDADIRAIEFEKYRNVFKDTLVRDIYFMRRVKDREGKEWLVYRYKDEIKDDAGDPRQFEFYSGFDVEDIPTIKRNNLRDIVEISFDKHRVVYSIPFTRENVEKAMAEAHNVPADLAICYANELGTTAPWIGNEMAIKNLDNFMDVPFDSLERMNKEGYNRKDGDGYQQMMEDDHEHTNKRSDLEDARKLNIQKAENQLKKARAAQQLP